MQNTPSDWTHNETIRLALEEYCETHDLTRADIGRRLGFSPTRVSKYINLGHGNKPEPDAERVEAAAKAFLRHIARRTALHNNLFPTAVADAVINIIRLIRKTGDIGVIHGRAGIGKTCAAELYARDTDGVCLITATRYNRDAAAVARMMFEQLERGNWPGNVKQSTWIEDTLRGTERVIIVDNAHKLHFSGLEWLFDLHDATLCSLVLIGNPEVRHVLLRSDQIFSRVGIFEQIHPSKKRVEDRKVASNLLKQLCPAAHDELIDAATDALGRLGHTRSLRKQLVLATEIHAAAGSGKSWTPAFDQALTRLITR